MTIRNTHIYPVFDQIVSRAEKEQRLNQKSKVYGLQVFQDQEKPLLLRRSKEIFLKEDI